ncbi:MAG: anhydro-N-acetylmuramic acid kinase [Bacteroidetes bacterium]|nr:anhydro-N-acetylmuramic acid kinase [Bacteroidota bacterium]
MVYHALGIMSGSSLDGLDLVFAHFHEQGGQWSFEIEATACYKYTADWENLLKEATKLDARAYCQLHVDYGHYLGKEVNRFIEEHQLTYKVSLIGSHGHTVFHSPSAGLTTQIGEGAALAATTELPVVTDLRTMDLAWGGQGAPLVPIGELQLFPGHSFFLNLGGIANITHAADPIVAFDCCPANRVLNLLASQLGQPYDQDGLIAARGQTNTALLTVLNDHPYYKKPYPKSLANEIGTDHHFPLLMASGSSIPDLLATYTQHIIDQIGQSAQLLVSQAAGAEKKCLVTGGGAFNAHLIKGLESAFHKLGISLELPSPDLINYKEALIMAFLAVLRWRQEYTVIPSVTGARKASIGGALWNGQEA